MNTAIFVSGTLSANFNTNILIPQKKEKKNRSFKWICGINFCDFFSTCECFRM